MIEPEHATPVFSCGGISLLTGNSCLRCSVNLVRGLKWKFKTNCQLNLLQFITLLISLISYSKKLKVKGMIDSCLSIFQKPTLRIIDFEKSLFPHHQVKDFVATCKIVKL
jgi:hypothetical protein